MVQRFILLLLISGLSGVILAQKTAYIPNYLQNPNTVDGAQFTWSKTRQSANFTMIWGNTVGTNPANYPDPNLAFNPEAILDTMEYIYAAFKDLGFLDDAAGTKLSQFKIPIVVYGTWGPNGAQGFANGGDADGVIGAFWVHPNALHDGGVAAHELAHSLQAQCVIDYRASHGLGPVWNNAGIFWETHANFMRNLLYPQAVSAWGMDVYHTETFGDWKNTYENYELLLAIMESEGIDMVNRLWRESFSTEYPLQAYKRLAGYNQATFNDSLFGYARRMATFDFTYNNIGKFFRQYRSADLQNYLPSIQATFSILKKVPGAENRYEIPIEVAPEEYAYNVIPLYPESDSCAVIIKFKGHTEANSHAGWRYGFVAAHPNGTVSRYSPTYSENTREINFRLEGDENKLYLVVMGAPFDQITTNTTNDTWHGYPKHFRYPYELNISGAVPEGFQAPANFRAQLKYGGHLHPNGGGWVQNAATVAASVYVGPSAMVLGNSNISGQVRIENTALVKNAVMSGLVRLLDNAFVNGGNYSGSAVIQGQGFAENVTMSNTALIGMRAKVTNYKLSGTVEVGGDVIVYNENGNCNNGVYYRLTNYYDNKLLECDGRTANHPVNKDVNNTYALFSNETMAAQCQCAYETTPILVDSMAITPVSCLDAAAGRVEFFISKSCGPFQYAWSKGAESGTNLSGLSSGNYNVSITDALGRQRVLPVEIPAAPVLTASLSATNYDCDTGLGGIATVQVFGAPSALTYSWNTGENAASVSDLTPGAYSVTTTDAAGCTVTGSVQVELSGALSTALTTTPITCHDQADGAASLTPLNGTAPFAWLWQGGATDSLRTDLEAGDYAATIIDALGCMDQQQFSLSNPEALMLSSATTSILCFGAADGTAAVQVVGGNAPFQWLWESGQTDSLRTDLSAGTYTVTVTNALGCSNTLSLSLSEPTPLFLLPDSRAVRCFGAADGMASIVASGGAGAYTYSWNNQELTDTITMLPAGVYSVTVTDLNGCSAAETEILVSSPPVMILEVDSPAILCADMEGNTVADASGGTAPYTYQWSTGETGPELISLAGIFTVSVTDAQGCQEIQTIEIQEASAVNALITIQAATSVMTADGAVWVTTVSGGVAPYSFLWNNGATTQSLENIFPGEYSLSITDAAGCVWVFTRTVSVESATNDLERSGFQGRIVPNPSASNAVLWLEVHQAQPLEITVSDVLGRVLSSKTEFFQTGKGVFELPEGLLAGMYWLRIRDLSGNAWVTRWVVTGL